MPGWQRVQSDAFVCMQVAQAKEENKRLHERIRVMEEELRRSYLVQDLASHP